MANCRSADEVHWKATGVLQNDREGFLQRGAVLGIGGEDQGVAASPQRENAVPLRDVPRDHGQ